MLTTVAFFLILLNRLDQAVRIIKVPNKKVSQTAQQMLETVARDLASHLNVNSWEKEKYYNVVYEFMAKQAPDNPDIMNDIAKIYSKPHNKDFIDLTSLPLSISDDFEVMSKMYISTNDEDFRRIFVGKKAQIKNWSFLASINYRNDFICAGVIIKSYLILTAASPFNNKSRNNWTVRVGSKHNDDEGSLIDVEQILSHPKYEEASNRNNLALLLLSKKLQYTKYVNEIQIEREFYSLRDIVTIAGWGFIKHGPDKDTSVLTSASMNITAVKLCEKYFSINLPGDNVCANSLLQAIGACKYDIGSPVVMRNALVGIVSFLQKTCTELAAPAIFTNLAPHIDWIVNISSMPFNTLLTTARITTTITTSITVTPLNTEHVKPEPLDNDNDEVTTTISHNDINNEHTDINLPETKTEDFFKSNELVTHSNAMSHVTTDFEDAAPEAIRKQDSIQSDVYDSFEFDDYRRSMDKVSVPKKGSNLSNILRNTTK